MTTSSLHLSPDQINWVNVRRVCLTWCSHVVTVIIWAVAITVGLIQFLWAIWRKAAPHVAGLLRDIADASDPTTAPLFAPITAADINAMDRQQLLTLMNPDRPVLDTPEPAQLEVVDAVYTYSDLKRMTKAQLKAIAGVKTNHITREQLIARIQHGKASA